MEAKLKCSGLTVFFQWFGLFSLSEFHRYDCMQFVDNEVVKGQ